MTPHPEIRFTYVSDPSHGWLLVPEAWIFASCLDAKSFSAYSYIKCVDDTQIYALEEDCDAPKFLQSFKTRFNVEPLFREYHHETCAIRSWERLETAAAAA